MNAHRSVVIVWVFIVREAPELQKAEPRAHKYTAVPSFVTGHLRGENCCQKNNYEGTFFLFLCWSPGGARLAGAVALFRNGRVGGKEVVRVPEHLMIGSNMGSNRDRTEDRSRCSYGRCRLRRRRLRPRDRGHTGKSSGLGQRKEGAPAACCFCPRSRGCGR